MDTKACSKCKKTKPFTDFSPDKRNKTKFRSQCKICARKDGKRYREENSSAVRNSNRAWIKSNPEKFAAINKRHKDKYVERYRQYSRTYYSEHREERQNYSRQWAANNLDKRLANQQRREARKLAAWVEDIDYQTVFNRDKWICQICFSLVDPEIRHPNLQCASLDHIIPLACAGEHSYANVQLAHLHCNIKKWKKMPL